MFNSLYFNYLNVIIKNLKSIKLNYKNKDVFIIYVKYLRVIFNYESSS